ncbi:hypothetical protein EDF62_0039 [Leucobacter luti]|uniref:Uncharacterized protein n=1 Tax=Leucobacter luti TaxID=340320 RepID=A0A4V3CYT6_9MICO|nr:hypothetical protein EDF62_0039 [Leucobacter luti]
MGVEQHVFADQNPIVIGSKPMSCQCKETGPNFSTKGEDTWEGNNALYR